MTQGPTLQTPRLILRPFQLADAPAVKALAGAYEVAFNTLLIPHPYEDGMAQAWITEHQPTFESGNFRFAITLRASDTLCGGIALWSDEGNQHAELGYWLGVPFWGRGYCTEAARAVVDYGFEVLHLNRMFATPFARNPASARVMQKVGMTHEGTLRQHFFKWGEFVDAEYYALLRHDWVADKDTK